MKAMEEVRRMARLDRSLFAAAALAAMTLWSAGCSKTRQATFESPEKAMAALGEAVKAEDRPRLEAILGLPDADVLESGDEIADCEHRARFLEMLGRKLEFEDRPEGTKGALLGDEEWPFAFPLVPDGDRWRFDDKAGLEELFNRRVGRDEILTIATLRAYVEGQKEYFSKGRDGNAPAYARKFVSAPGRQDGLFWEADEGQAESPLGPLAARAALEDSSAGREGPIPYHGYLYRIIERQGKDAPGGEKSYVDPQGLMTGGFAAIAWPAKYGNSGIKTFQVNALGIVFEKDLGPDTAKIAEAMAAYDPDDTWMPVAN
jgi:hypothetical protein